jgi:hypothetical protein
MSFTIHTHTTHTHTHTHAADAVKQNDIHYALPLKDITGSKQPEEGTYEKEANQAND